MRTRLTVVGLVAGAAVLDVAGVHGAAYLLLVAAVPVSAAAALLALGYALAAQPPTAVARLRCVLGGTVLALVLLAAASRAPLVTAGEVPAIAAAALLACLVVVASDLLLGAVDRLHAGGRAVGGGALRALRLSRL